MRTKTIEEMQKSHTDNKPRKFYNEIKNSKREDGNLIADEDNKCKRWKDYLEELLNEEIQRILPHQDHIHM